MCMMRPPDSPIRVGRASAARAFMLALVVALAACESSTAPLRNREDVPLVAIDIWGAPPRANDGYLSFTTGFLDSEPALRPGESVLLRIRSSRGDEETLRFGLGRPVRIGSVVTSQLPREYVLVAVPGADFDALLQQAEVLGARHRRLDFGVATSFVAIANEAAAVAAIRALPGVQGFEPNTYSCLIACEPITATPLWATILLDQRASAVMDDGLLSVASGDTLRIQYRSSFGVLQQFQTVVQ